MRLAHPVAISRPAATAARRTRKARALRPLSFVHPHGLSNRDFDSLFTATKPVIFNFHSYASLVHKLTYNRTNHDNLHVHGYHEKGNINTPLELAILNQVDRFNLVIDVLDRLSDRTVAIAWRDATMCHYND